MLRIVGPPDSREMLLDQPAVATQVGADDRPDRKMPDGIPGAGQVPAGFTNPTRGGVHLLGLKSTPLKLDRGVAVLNAEDLVTRHLEILAAKQRPTQAGSVSCGPWPPC